MKVKYKRLMWLIIFLWVLIPLNLMVFYGEFSFLKLWAFSLIDICVIVLFCLVMSMQNGSSYTLSEENDTFKNKSLEFINSLLKRIKLD